ISSVEKLKEEWKEKEEAFSIAIRDQKVKAKEKIAELQDQKEQNLQIAKVAEALEESDLKLKDEVISALDNQVKMLLEDVNKLTSSNNDLSSKVLSLERATAKIKTEYAQIQEVNQSLMEEAESYQILLEQRTLNGEFQSSDIMKNSDEFSISSGTLADELGGNISSESYEKKISTLQGEIKALTLYIEKILPKVLIDDGFETISRKGDLRKRESRIRIQTTPPPRSFHEEIPVIIPAPTSPNARRNRPLLTVGTNSPIANQSQKSPSLPTSPFLKTVAGFFVRQENEE
ncbi:hypothetical protein HK096_001560, partial [Nowakowskiella sp. JEL0078]